MANDIKRTDLTARLSDRLRVAATVIGLAVAAKLLPTPWQLPTVLAPRRVATSGDLDFVVNAVTLGAASIAVWLLISWILVIGTLTLIARTPGICGRLARGALARITPGFVRRTIAIGMSVGALTGVAVSSAPSTAGLPIQTSVSVDGQLRPTGHPIPTGQLVTPIDRAALAVATSADRVGDRAAAPTGRGAVAEASAQRGLVHEAPAHRGYRPAEAAGRGTGTAARGVPSPTPVGQRNLPIDVDWPVHRPASPGTPSAATPLVDKAPVDLDWPSDRAVVVVHRGDSLWSIAASRLGPSATDAQIDAAWRSWYAVNRAVIGDDPDLILPGQRLQAPPAATP